MLPMKTEHLQVDSVSLYFVNKRNLILNCRNVLGKVLCAQSLSCVCLFVIS